MKISYSLSQKRLAICWFVSAMIIFIIVLFQSLFGKFDDSISEVWSWILSSIVPSLSLMITVFIANLSSVYDHEIDRFYFRLALWVSIGYFILLFSHILIQPFTNKSELEIVNQSKIYMGTIQGVVSSCLGLFFVKKEKMVVGDKI